MNLPKGPSLLSLGVTGSLGDLSRLLLPYSLAEIVGIPELQGPFLLLPFLTAGSYLPTKASSGRSLRLPSPAVCLAWVPAALQGPPAPAPLPATSPCPCRAAVLSPESPSTWCSPASLQCCPEQGCWGERVPTLLDGLGSRLAFCCLTRQLTPLL